MKVWTRATGAIKDKLSLISATDKILTAAIIKATSHNDQITDTNTVKFINSYINNNPSSFKPILRAISKRVEHTRSWKVALKCLILLHGLFLAGNKSIELIGRLPFDLSDFGKSKSRFSKTGRFNVFVRAYFSFLDERSILYFDESKIGFEMIIEMQRTVDLLMRIKPVRETPLVIEAMELVVREILDIYAKIGNEFAGLLLSDVNGRSEDELAVVKIATKTLLHGEEVLKYFEFCRHFGVTNAREIPCLLRVSEAQVKALDKLLRDVPKRVSYI